MLKDQNRCNVRVWMMEGLFLFGRMVEGFLVEAMFVIRRIEKINIYVRVIIDDGRVRVGQEEEFLSIVGELCGGLRAMVIGMKRGGGGLFL